MKVNDRVHVVNDDGTFDNAWFVADLGDGKCAVELDDNVYSEVDVDRSRLRRKWHSQG